MISYDDVKENLIGILMSAQQSVCPTDVDDISDALTLIEQLQSRVVELETTLQELGYCVKCNSIPEHHVTEPFSSCKCGTGEDYATKPLQKFQTQVGELEQKLEIQTKRGDLATSAMDTSLELKEALDSVKQERDALVEKLKLACELARDNHGKMLMTDPPQCAWKYNQVTSKLVEAISAAENGVQESIDVMRELNP